MAKRLRNDEGRSGTKSSNTPSVFKLSDHIVIFTEVVGDSIDICKHVSKRKRVRMPVW